MIPNETVELIHQTAIIEDVIGDYVELKKQGSSFRGLSLFTNEKTPSFYVVQVRGYLSVLVRARRVAILLWSKRRLVTLKLLK